MRRYKYNTRVGTIPWIRSLLQQSLVFDDSDYSLSELQNETRVDTTKILGVPPTRRSCSRCYSLTGKKDDLGIVHRRSTSLRHILMGICHNFLNKEGMLQHIAKILGVTALLLTPKYHAAELAGEGGESV